MRVKRLRENFVKERPRPAGAPLSPQLTLINQHVNYIIHQQSKGQGSPLVLFHPKATPPSITNNILLLVSTLHVYSVLYCIYQWTDGVKFMVLIQVCNKNEKKSPSNVCLMPFFLIHASLTSDHWQGCHTGK